MLYNKQCGKESRVINCEEERNVKKGDILEGIIEDYSFPNKGSLTCEDRRVTVKGAFQGQRVQYRVTKKKSGKAEGVLLKVLEKSELEDATPICPHFGECGGCMYQTMSYKNQLKTKKKMVKKLLDSVVSDYEFQGIFGSPDQIGYRNKMEFTFGDAYKDGPLTLGLHKKGSFYDILPITGCTIVKPGWNEILKYTQEFFTERNVPYYKRMKHTGILRNLVIRQSSVTGEFLINLVTTTKMSLTEEDECEGISVKDMLDLEDYVAGLLKLEEDGKLNSPMCFGRIAGVLHTENDSLSDVVQSDRTTLLYGVAFLIEEVMGLKFMISPFSFFQTNTRGCEVLYKKAREYVLSAAEKEPDHSAGEQEGTDGSENFADKVIFDLYSGTGTIAQMLAPIAKKVVGIEIVEEAVAAARENAAINGLTNCDFIAGDVLKVLDEVAEKPDFIVLDPPRDGIHPKALEKIIAYGVQNIVYISCKPTSLVRDLAVFQERGYKVEKACAIDQFPGTAHVETVALLVKKR